MKTAEELLKERYEALSAAYPRISYMAWKRVKESDEEDGLLSCQIRAMQDYSAARELELARYILENYITGGSQLGGLRFFEKGSGKERVPSEVQTEWENYIKQKQG